MEVEPVNGHLSHYETGATPLFACAADQRFSYCLYVPDTYKEGASRPFSLTVLVHGTGRNPFRYRDGARDFAEHNSCLILCPLFPAGIPAARQTENYKLLSYQGIRFDLILLAMIEEVSKRYRVNVERFCLFGFSGGAHFAHRFLYVHPERLRAVSIDAPGVVTLLDLHEDWWCGVRGLEAVFGKPLDLEAMRRVVVQTIVGAADTETWEIGVEPGSPYWMEGYTPHGRTRVERIQALGQSLRNAGVAVEHIAVPGLAHEPALDPALDFFSRALASDHEHLESTRTPVLMAPARN